MITYNHEDYIAEAINGVLAQKTNFIIELIIAEDLSTDNTRKICEQFANEHPSLISLLPSIKNHGMQANFIRAFNNCKGHYIALCEGDDYWTDPLKLQKQVDFLESNPDYSICFHPVNIKQEQTGKLVKDYITEEVPEITTIEDLAKRGNYIHTPSVVFRHPGALPEYFQELSIGDYPVHLLNAENGKIKKLAESMAVYRVHEGGIWSLTEFKNKILIKHNLLLKLKDIYKHNEDVSLNFNAELTLLSIELMKTTKEDEFLSNEYFEKAIETDKNYVRTYIVRRDEEFWQLKSLLGSSSKLLVYIMKKFLKKIRAKLGGDRF